MQHLETRAALCWFRKEGFAPEGHQEFQGKRNEASPSCARLHCSRSFGSSRLQCKGVPVKSAIVLSLILHYFGKAGRADKGNVEGFSLYFTKICFFSLSCTSIVSQPANSFSLALKP